MNSMNYPIINNMLGHFPRNEKIDFGKFNDENCSICRELYYNCNIIYSTENFSIIPDVGQVTEGYIQIISNKHKDLVDFSSITKLPYHLFKELKELISYTKTLLKNKYGNSFVFEHGETSHIKKDNNIHTTHLHIHIVPIESSIMPQIKLNKSLEIKNIQSIYELLDFSSNNQPYFFIEDLDNICYLITYISIESQIFRKYINNLDVVRSENKKWLKANNYLLDSFDCWDCMKFRPADRFYKTFEVLRNEYINNYKHEQ